MASIAASAAKASLNDSFTNIKSKLSNSGEKKPKCDWNHYNWPPLVRVMHLDMDELEGFDVKTPVRNMFLSHLFVFGITVLNLVCTIVQVAMGESGLRLFYTFVMLVSFNPLHTFWFYCGYKGIVDEPGLLNRFKYVGFGLAVVYVVSAIIPWGNFNGFVRVAELFSAGQAFPGILSLIESIAWVLTAMYVVFQVLQARRYVE